MPIRATYVMRNGRLVRKRKNPSLSSGAAGPQIMSDIAPVQVSRETMQTSGLTPQYDRPSVCAARAGAVS